MNIVVPLAGKEKEFESGGLFKPLIDVSGKPLIARCTERHSWLLGNPKNRLIFIVLKEHDGKFNASMRLRELYGSSAQIVVIPELTSGAACTVLAAKGLIDSQESLAIFLADIDFRADLEGAMARCLHEGLSGAIPCFPSLDKKYSYAEEGADGFVSRVAEKEAISQNASAGFYFFPMAATSCSQRSG